MKLTLIISFFILTTFNLDHFSKKESKVIQITTLGDVDPKYVLFVKTSIESFYGFKCIIMPSQKVSIDILSNSKKRLDAPKILEKFDSKKHTIILTEKDISHKRGKIDEYGIIGLGFCPGKICVVSTYRIKNKKNQKVFYDRLKKVTLHEIGHNLGIPHCVYDQKCLMNDVKGTLKTIDKENVIICNNCYKKIK